MASTIRSLHPPRRTTSSHAVAHRSALDAALRKAAVLDRLDPRGDAYGAAGQALEDFVKRADQILARGLDVTGWISVVTERRWINELRYQRRRGYDCIDRPVAPESSTTLADVTAERGLLLEDVVVLRERINDIVLEQRAALDYLRAEFVRERHVRVVELALKGDLAHHEIAAQVNAEYADAPAIAPNSVTQVIRRQRQRLAAAGTFPSAVKRLRRAHRAP